MVKAAAGTAAFIAVRVSEFFASVDIDVGPPTKPNEPIESRACGYCCAASILNLLEEDEGTVDAPHVTKTKAIEGDFM